MDLTPIARPSSLDGYADCARRIVAKDLRHIVEHVTGVELRQLAPHIGASVGIAVHAAAQFTLSTKLQSHGQDLGKQDEADAVAIDRLREHVAGGVIWDQATSRLNDAEKQVQRMGKKYRRAVAPKVNVVFVESRETVDAGDGWLMSGQADIVAREPNQIRDLKSGKTMGFHMAQLGSYSLIYRGAGVVGDIEHLVIDHVPRTVLSQSQADPVEIVYDVALAENIAARRLADMKNDVGRFMETGDPAEFVANPSSMLCKSKFCPAWGTKFCREHAAE